MKTIILFLCLVTTQLNAGLYSEQEITQFLNQQIGKESTLTRNILTNPSPTHIVKAWLLSEQDELNKEHQLFNLLNHLSTMTPTESLSPLLVQLSNYQAKAVRTHPEASHSHQANEAIFNIASRAAGVQNIWQMKTDQLRAIQILSSSKSAASDLDYLISKSKSQNATLLGIKNAFQDISSSSIDQFKNQLYQSPPSPLLFPVISDLALVSQDINFIYWAIEHVNKQQAERIYRLVAQKLSTNQSIKILTANTKSAANPAFVASLLSPHVNQTSVSNFLIKQLNNKSAVKGAAFALSKSHDPLVWKKMEQIHNNSKSEAIKKSIRFSFKLNKLEGAKMILQRLEKKQGAQS